MPDIGGISIAVKGAENWKPVLFNLMKETGLSTESLPPFTKRGQSIYWLFSAKSRPYQVIYNLSACSAIFCICSKLCGKKVINHWIGSDARRYKQPKTPIKKLTAWIQKYFVTLQLCDSEIIQEELKQMGINTHIIRLLPETIQGEVYELPEKRAVLSYWDDNRFKFYGGPLVFSLAKAFPEVSFLIARAEGKGIESFPANVKFLGKVTNMHGLYRKCNCLIRLPEHDGLSAMVLEAMANGRYVIYNKPVPFTDYADDFDSAYRMLKNVFKRTEPNFEGAKYVRDNFSIEKESRRLKELIQEYVIN